MGGEREGKVERKEFHDEAIVGGFLQEVADCWEYFGVDFFFQLEIAKVSVDMMQSVLGATVV